MQSSFLPFPSGQYLRLEISKVCPPRKRSQVSLQQRKVRKARRSVEWSRNDVIEFILSWCKYSSLLDRPLLTNKYARTYFAPTWCHRPLPCWSHFGARPVLRQDAERWTSGDATALVDTMTKSEATNRSCDRDGTCDYGGLAAYCSDRHFREELKTEELLQTTNQVAMLFSNCHFRLDRVLTWEIEWSCNNSCDATSTKKNFRILAYPCRFQGKAVLYQSRNTNFASLVTLLTASCRPKMSTTKSKYRGS